MKAQYRFVSATCAVCGAPFQAKAWGRQVGKLCSPECRKVDRSRRMSRTNLEHCSDRMKANNPMRHAEVRAKVASAHKESGHKPRIQGGNGRVVPAEVAALKLVRALGDGWEPQVAIPTGRGAGSGYPPTYKVDLGNPGLRLAVEVDGSSHLMLSRQAEDRKKEALLASLGWTVFRMTNREAMSGDPSTISRLKAVILTLQTAS